MRTSSRGVRFSAGQGDPKEFANDIRRLSAHINRPQYVYPISLSLRKALGEIRRALLRGDISHAADLTRVKSYIGGQGSEGSPNTFWESGSDHKLYSYLDSLNFELSMKSNKMPGGMTEFRSMGVGKPPVMISAPPVQPTSPTLKLIAREDKRIRGNE